MNFAIVENDTWWRGGMYALLIDGEKVMVSDSKKVLLRYLELLQK